MFFNRLILEHKYIKAYAQRFEIEIIVRAIIAKLKDSPIAIIKSNELPRNIKFGILDNIEFECECSDNIKETKGVYDDKYADFDKYGNVHNLRILIDITKDNYNSELNHYYIRKAIYHELNHFYDDLAERASKKESIFNKLRGQNAQIYYDKIIQDFSMYSSLPDGYWQVPQLIYYLLIDTEFDAHITQSYVDCYTLNIKSINDFKSSTPTYKMYDEMKYTFDVLTNKYKGLPIVNGRQYFSQRFLSTKKIQKPTEFKNWYVAQVTKRLRLFEERILEIADFYIQTSIDVDELNKRISDYYDSLRQLRESKGPYTMRKNIVKVPVYGKNYQSRDIYEIDIDECLIDIIKNI